MTRARWSNSPRYDGAKLYRPMTDEEGAERARRVREGQEELLAEALDSGAIDEATAKRLRRYIK